MAQEDPAFRGNRAERWGGDMLKSGAQAVSLADRAVVMTPRFGRIAEILIVDLACLRTLEMFNPPVLAGGLVTI